MDRFGLQAGQLGSLRTAKSLLSVVFQVKQNKPSPSNASLRESLGTVFKSKSLPFSSMAMAMVVVFVFQGLVAGRAVRMFGERMTFAGSLAVAALGSLFEYTVTDVKVGAGAGAGGWLGGWCWWVVGWVAVGGGWRVHREREIWRVLCFLSSRLSALGTSIHSQLTPQNSFMNYPLATPRQQQQQQQLQQQHQQQQHDSSSPPL
jgi:hypothetical protein